MKTGSGTVSMIQRKRLVLSILAALAVALGCGLAAILAGRLALVEWALRTLPPRLDLPPIEAKARALTLHGLTLEDIVIGRDLGRVARLTATYSPADLLEGRLDGLTLDAPVLTGALDGLQPRLPLLDALSDFGGGGDSEAIAIPLNRLDITQGTVILDGPRGPVTLAADITLRPDDGANWSVSLTGAANGPDLEAKGQSTLTLSADGRVLDASGTLDGALEVPTLEGLAETIALSARLSGGFSNGVLSAESPGLTLTIDRLAPDVRAALPEPLAPILSGPLTLTLGGEAPIRLALSMTDDGPADHLSGPLSLTTTAEGRGRATLGGRVDLTLPQALSQPNPQALAGTLDARLDAVGLPLANLAGSLDGALDATVTLDGGGGAKARIAEGGWIDLTTPAATIAQVLDLLLPDRSATAPPRLTVTGGPLRLARMPDGVVTAEGALSLTPDPERAARVALSVENLSLSPGAPPTVAVRSATLAVSELAPAGVKDLSATLIATDAHWNGKRITGHLVGTGSLAALTLAKGALEGLTLDLDTSLTVDPAQGRLRASPSRLALTVASGRPTPDVALGAPLALVLAEPGAMAVDWVNKRVLLEKARLAPMDLSVILDGGPLTVSGLGATLSGTWPIHPRVPPALLLEGGTLEGFGLRAEDLSADLALERGGPRGRVTATVTRLPGEARPAKGARPLALEMTLSHPAPDGDRTHFPLVARLRDPLDRVTIGLEGWTSPDLSQGQLRLAASPVAFSPKGLQPKALHAALDGIASDVEGTLALKGTLAWDGTRLKPDLSILAQDVSVTLGGVPMEHVNGVIRLTQFWPPRGPSQEISVGTVDLGLPMTNALIHYALDGKGNLLLENASLELAGGRVETGPVTIPLKGGQILVPLDVRGVALTELAGLTKLDGLAASGTLGGRVPLRVEPDGAIWVDNATLETEGPGLLSYRPPEDPEIIAAGNQGVLLLLLALDDFQYERLGLTLDGESSGELAVGIILQGANPALYDGYPVDLRVNLSGALTELVRKNLHTYTLPNRIQENLEHFMKSLGYTGATAPSLPPAAEGAD
jgi:hypothetical protein